MALSVLGAGFGRTGTESLKKALEILGFGPCYHMFEMGKRVEEHGPRWWAALNGEVDQLDGLLEDWEAAVDWPASIFWRELAVRHADALVILSHRGDSATWWKSADATVWQAMRRSEAGDDEMIREFNRSMRRGGGLGDDWDDEAVARAWYDAHHEAVIREIPADRLLVWQPADGFGPVAERLGVPAPDVAPVHANTTAEFRSQSGLD